MSLRLEAVRTRFRLRPLPFPLSDLLRTYREVGRPFGFMWEGFALWVRFHGGSRAN